jgi:hypothetical protein
MQATWGRIVWIFFHTFAEKIDATFFEENIDACLNIVVTICQNLPCPVCTVHANMFLRKHRIKQLVKTKDDFKRYLFLFHNHANTITRKASSKIDILSIYERAVFDRVALAFVKTYNNRSPFTRAYADKLSRSNVAKDTMNFLKQNYKFFSN